MAIQKITFDAASVSSKMDADINHFLTSGVHGIFYGILGRCQASVSNNYISFQSGYVQVYGRRIYVESGTKISVSLDGSAYGYVIIKIDLGNNTISLEKKEASSAYPTLTQNDLMNGGLIYEFPLCRYTKTSSSITLDGSYTPPYIYNDQTNINSKGTQIRNDVSSDYGPLWDGYSSLSYGNVYVFTGITSLNAYNGIISLYVGGANVIFCGASVGGSGGIVHYRYNGQDCTLSCQLTSSKLYVEDSRGNQPKYARVIRQAVSAK